jgi:hypothetical protein
MFCPVYTCENHSSNVTRGPRLRALLERGHHLGGRVLSVALGVIGHPAPQVLAGVLHCQLRLPVQLLVCARGVRRQVENITLSPRHHIVGQVTAHNLAKGLDHLEDRAAPTRSQVPRLNAGLVLAQVVQSNQVALGKINNVNVVADGSAVSGRVV